MKKLCVSSIALLILPMIILALQFDATTGSYIEVSNSAHLFPDSVLLYSFPSPDGSPRGLAFDGSYLWCANTGDGNSVNGAKIYKLDPITGAIVNTYSSPGTNPFGLAWDGSYLWHSDFGTGMIYKIDTSTMTSVSSFSYSSGYMFDIAWDGTYLWGTFGNSDYMVCYDVNSGTPVDTVIANYTSPEVRPMGLCYVPENTGQIWTCDGSSAGASNFVHQWDFSSSSWINHWNANPALYPDGLAYDSLTGRLWVSCWTNDMIYVYEFAPNSVEEEIVAVPGSFACYVSNVDQTIEISFELPENRHVSISVFAVSGSLIRAIENRYFEKGSHSISFDSREIPSGVYFTKFSTEDFSSTQRIIVAR